MAAGHIKSTEINIYPTAYRSNIELIESGVTKTYVFDPESRLNTEDNITRPYKFLAEYNSGSFVVTSEWNTTLSYFEFVLKGYYFKIKNPTKIFESNNDWYAHIRIKTNGKRDNNNINYEGNSLSPVQPASSNVVDLTTLDQKIGSENEFKFIGLYINNSPNLDSVTTNVISLKLLQKSGDSMIIPKQSKMKLKHSSVYGGSLESNDQPLSDYLSTNNIDINGNLSVGNREYSLCVNRNNAKTGSIKATGNVLLDTADLTLNTGDIYLQDIYNSKLEATKDLTVEAKQGDLWIKASQGNVNIQYNDASCVNFNNLISIQKDRLYSSSNDFNIYNSNDDGLRLKNGVISIRGNSSEWFNLSKTNIKLKLNGNESLSIYNDNTSIYHFVNIGTSDSHKGLDVYGDERIHNDQYVHGKSEITGNLEAKSGVNISGGDLILASQSANDFAVKIDSTGKLISNDLSAHIALEGSNKTTRFVTSISQGTNGKVSYTTDYFEITAGEQGAIKLNNSPITITNLGVWGEPIFYTVTAKSSFNVSCDKRLKENIVDYKLEKSILDLPVYKYDYIEGKKNQIGCLAQDLQEICPEIVNTNDEGYLTIQESKIVYLLLEEVKKLKKEVEELKK